MNKQCRIFLILLPSLLCAQPNYTHLLYEHDLSTNSLGPFAEFVNDGGNFLNAIGWQASTEASQLRITLPQALPPEGSMLLDVTNFDPVSQNLTEVKQHIINMYSRIYANNKDVFETDASWWNIRTGTYYSDGAGMAGFKFLAAARGVDSRGEIRLLQSNTWNLQDTHQFKITWTTADIYIFLDDIQLAKLPFSGQVEPFRYILIGKDNLIYGYAGQPGPIYANLKIYGAESTHVENETPQLLNVVATETQKVVAVFDQPLTINSATSTQNFLVDAANVATFAILLNDAQRVQISTSEPLTEGEHQLTVRNIAGAADSSAILHEAILPFTYTDDFHITNISRPMYQLCRRDVGDSVYVDRDFQFTDIPNELGSFYWLQTANDDKYSTGDDFLHFTINRDAVVWLARDSSIPSLPAWMQDWQPTVYTAQTNDATFRFYVKYFLAGDVVLGGNAGERSSSMYLLTVVPHTASGPDISQPDPPQNLRMNQTLP